MVKGNKRLYAFGILMFLAAVILFFWLSYMLDIPKNNAYIYEGYGAVFLLFILSVIMFVVGYKNYIWWDLKKKNDND